MGRRPALLALAVVVGFQLAASCNPASEIVVLSPAGDVTTYSFTVQFEVTGSQLDASSVEATLNGEPMILSGGPVYTASIDGGGTIDAGFPLRDNNSLQIRAQKLNGTGGAVKNPAFRL